MLKRVKRRYIAFEVESSDTLSADEVMDVLWTTIEKLYGEYGASRAGLALIEYDSTERLAIVRVGLAAVEMVRATLAAVTKIKNTPVAMHVIVVCGTLNALRNRLGK